MAEQPFLGTQTRILLTEWKALAKVIVAHSMAAKDKPITSFADLENFDIENLENLTLATTDEIPHILSEKQINTALQGPFGAAIKQKMAAYAIIARLRLELHLNKEEIFKGKRLTLPPEQQIPEKKLLKLSFSQIDETQTNLDQITEQHDQEWQNFLQRWNEQLLAFLNKSTMPLTEREIKEFKDEDIATELLPRFSDVGLTLPKKNYAHMSFSDYLQLKAQLTVQSSLSRRHLSHTNNDIEQVLKNFSEQLTTMQNQEQQLLERQQAAIDSVIQQLG